MMCSIRAETFMLYFAHRPKGLKHMQKSWQHVGKLLLMPLLSALFRGVAEFPQHFQKYLLLQKEQRRAGKGRWGQARGDLHSCNQSYCFVSVELIKWINCRHIFSSGNAFPNAVVIVRSGKKKRARFYLFCYWLNSLQCMSLNKYFLNVKIFLLISIKKRFLSAQKLYAMRSVGFLITTVVVDARYHWHLLLICWVCCKLL